MLTTRLSHRMVTATATTLGAFVLIIVETAPKLRF